MPLKAEELPEGYEQIPFGNTFKISLEDGTMHRN